MTAPDPLAADTRAADDVMIQLGELARRELDVATELRREHRLVEDLQLDSLRVLTLAVAVEDHFRIMLDENDEEGLETVGDLVDAVVQKRAQERAADG